jgi:SWI/SNF-related matrix-associated actin-dependent regulator 1 of chromatin subfamily A
MGLDDDRIRDRAAFDATTEPNGWKLRDYQHDGREFILGRRGTLLADGMRVGKTGQCTAAHDPSSGPMLVVGPLAVREVWMAWFKRRWPDIRPTVLKGRHVEKLNPKKPTKPRRDRGFDVLDGERFSPQALKDAKLIFCNYDILGAWKEFGGRQIGTLVLDEIHLVSDRTSKRARAVEYIAAPANAHRVIAVSGTPIWNQPSGLYTTLASTCHIAFGRFFDYASRYCNLRPGSHGYLYDGSSNEAEFRERLSEVMIRRTWQDVSGQMPTIERTVEVVDITEAQTFEVEKQAERVRDHARMSTSVGALARFRRLLAKLKMPAAIDAAHRVLLSGEKVIVWTWHRDVALEIEDALAKKDFPGFVVAGATSMDMREDIINRWRAHPSPVPLVIALLVGQVGIDLTAAAHEVFAEIDFTPAVIAQAEMRPVTPLRPTFATYVIIDHEIERKILAALSDKCDTAFRVGVPAAESTVGVLAAAFSAAADGPNDFSALAAAIMSDHPDMDDIDGGDGSNFHGSLWTHDWET